MFRYFDVLDRDGIIQRALEINDSHYIKEIGGINYEIDYVDPHGNLDIIDKQFKHIFSSHSLVSLGVSFEYSTSREI